MEVSELGFIIICKHVGVQHMLYSAVLSTKAALVYSWACMKYVMVLMFVRASLNLLHYLYCINSTMQKGIFLEKLNKETYCYN